MKKNRVVLIAGLALILGGFGYLVYGGIGSNLVYFLEPAELLSKGDKVYGEPVRLGGQVMAGTVKWDADAIDLRFTLTDGKQQVEVHSKKAPPQMFREGQGVVVEGKLTRDGVFESHNLMVKHSNEYQPPHDMKDPRDSYKSLIRGETD